MTGRTDLEKEYRGSCVYAVRQAQDDVTFTKGRSVQTEQSDYRGGGRYAMHQRVLFDQCTCQLGLPVKLQFGAVEQYVDGMIKTAICSVRKDSKCTFTLVLLQYHDVTWMTF